MSYNTSTDHSNETLMWCDMFLFTCLTQHNKVGIMLSRSQSQMWCITISFGRESNIKGRHSAFGVDSWIFGVSRGCCIEPSEGTSKLVEFTSTFWTFQTFTNLMIFCSNQANSFSLSLWYNRQIVHKMNIRVSQIVKFSICWPFNRSIPGTTMPLLYSHWKQTFLWYVRREVMKTCYWSKPFVNNGFDGK
jgi:hypothetical protein